MIVLGSGIVSLVVGIMLTEHAGETAPIGLALGVMLVTAGLLARR